MRRSFIAFDPCDIALLPLAPLSLLTTIPGAAVDTLQSASSLPSPPRPPSSPPITAITTSAATTTAITTTTATKFDSKPGVMRKFLGSNAPTKEDKERERDAKERKDKDKDKKDKKDSASSSSPSRAGSNNPFASWSGSTNPFRRMSTLASSSSSRSQQQPQLVDAPPPPYTGPSSSDPAGAAGSVAPAANTLQNTARASSSRNVAPSTDPYASLARFDTVFLIDDSSSMTGSRWAETGKVLAEIVPVCTRYDSDGVDVHFLNATAHTGRNIRSPAEVVALFRRVSPAGITPTGRRLGDLLSQYLDSYRRNRALKPLNIICITDGEPTDPSELERALERTAQSLDDLRAPDRQVGVQFFQVGNDSNATLALDELDNGMAEKGIRDMIDTVSFSQINGGRGLSAAAILKVVLGAVDRTIDRKRRIA